MDERERLPKLLELVERMTREASKDKLAEAVQVLALEVAYYRGKVGQLPTDEALSMLDISALNDDQVFWVVDALEGVAATLASIPDLSPPIETKH